jgi:pimeloyl-ACP methyl ester carboxylesterase
MLSVSTITLGRINDGNTMHGDNTGHVFYVSVQGSDDPPLVLMLHGFGVLPFFWNAQVHAAAQAGYFAVAPNQQGYAAGARPDPADHASYHVD